MHVAHDHGGVSVGRGQVCWSDHCSTTFVDQREHQESWGVWLNSHRDSGHRPAYAPPGRRLCDGRSSWWRRRNKGQRVEQPLLSFVRDQQVVLEHLGLTLAEGKRLLQAVQQRMVAAQVKRHGAVYRRCGHGKRKLTTKGYQRRWFRSAFGKVPIRVRRLTSCPCQGEPWRTFSSLPLSGPRGSDRAGMALSPSEAGEPHSLRARGHIVGGCVARQRGPERRDRADARRSRRSSARRRDGARVVDAEGARAPDPEVLFRYPYYRTTATGHHRRFGLRLRARTRHPRPEHHFEVVAGRGARAPNGTSRLLRVRPHARVLVCALRAGGCRRRGRRPAPRHRPHRWRRRLARGSSTRPRHTAIM